MTPFTTSRADLRAQRSGRLAAALATAPFDAWLSSTPANTEYATGYSSATLAVGELPTCAAVVTPERTVLCGPAGEWAAAVCDAGVRAENYLPYGRFFFATHGTTPGPGTAHPDLPTALADALRQLGLPTARLAVDEAFDPRLLAELRSQLPGVQVVDGSSWALQVRSRKTAGELERMARSAMLAETGIARAVEQARVGVSELALMAIVGSTMLEGGGLPQFLVVTSGPRSAHSDTFATGRVIQEGDLVRFDVGCTVEGYWSDVGRTAVVGEPDTLQQERYEAILAGEQRQLDSVRAGMTAEKLFQVAVEGVEAGGLVPYRRQHCGHGIGLEVYEPPIINAAATATVEAGMTFCVETPFYELGWGGMMVEDMIVITEGGHARLTHSDRSLVVIDR
jgi:Xaa-Pro aminopeptidase